MIGQVRVIRLPGTVRRAPARASRTASRIVIPGVTGTPARHYDRTFADGSSPAGRAEKEASAGCITFSIMPA